MLEFSVLADPLVRPFWDWAARGELRLPRGVDGAFDWYPTGAEVSWVRLTGYATLYSWAVVERPLDPRYTAIIPYISAIVIPDDAPGVRLVTRLVELTATPWPGMPLKLRIADLAFPGDSVGVPAPLFGPAN